MEAVLFIFGACLMHSIVVGTLSAPVIYIGRKRVHWRKWELLAVYVPFAIWAALMCSDLSTGRKSMANLGEFIYISLAVPVAAIIRVVVGKWVPEAVFSAILLLCLSGVAVAVFCFTPFLPE